MRGGSVLRVSPSPQPSALRLQAQGLAHRAVAPPGRGILSRRRALCSAGRGPLTRPPARRRDRFQIPTAWLSTAVYTTHRKETDLRPSYTQASSYQTRRDAPSKKTPQSQPHEKHNGTPTAPHASIRDQHCEEWRTFPSFSLFSFFGAPKNGASILHNAV